MPARATRASLALRRAAEFRQALKRQVQGTYRVGLLVGKVRWEPLAAVRVNPVSKEIEAKTSYIEVQGGYGFAVGAYSK